MTNFLKHLTDFELDTELVIEIGKLRIARASENHTIITIATKRVHAVKAEIQRRQETMEIV